MKKDDLLLPFIKTVHHLQNPEHQEYVSRLMLLGVLVLAINDPELTALWNKFKKYGTIEDLLYNKPKSAEETSRIAELNTKRTLTFTYIIKFLDNVIKRSPDEADVEKAKHLDFVSEPYKNLVNKNIPSRTADIRNFIQDFKLEPNAAYVESFDLTKAVDVLETKNLDLADDYELRALAWLEKDKHGTLTQVRTKVDEALTEVSDTLLFLYRANERGAKDDALRAKLEAIFTTWNAYTQQFERVLSQRGVETTHGKPSVDFDNMLPDTPEPPSPPLPPPLGE